MPMLSQKRIIRTAWRLFLPFVLIFIIPSFSLAVYAAEAAVPGGEISISNIADDAYQFTTDQGISSFTLTCDGTKNSVFEVSTNNPSILKCSVNGTNLIVNAVKAGRAAIRVVEKNTGITRYVGVRVKNAAGQMPAMPDYLAIGNVSTNAPKDLSFLKDFQNGDKNKRLDIRYVYFNGEPDAWERNVDGWQKSGNLRGEKASVYIKESKKIGMIPFFVYGMVYGSNESYQTGLHNIQSDKYLGYYFKDLKFFLDIIAKEGGDNLVGIIFEPDFIGYMMQNSGMRPEQIKANTKLAYEKGYGGSNAVGILDSKVDKDPSTNKPFADNLQGFIKCVNYLASKYNKIKGSNIYFGWQFNTWANPASGVPTKGLMFKTDEMGVAAGREFIAARAKETADYYTAAGILSFDAAFIAIDNAVGRGPEIAQNSQNSNWFWNADNWNNYLLYVKELHNKTGRPVILCQLPVGHIERSQATNPYHGGQFKSLANDDNSGYEDSATTFFFGDSFKPGNNTRFSWLRRNASNDPLIKSNNETITWDAHILAARNAGVCAALFGASRRTTHGNISNVSNPSSEPEDDMWFLVKVQRYYGAPVNLKNSI